MFEKLRQNQVKIPIKIFMGFLRARAVPSGDSKNLARFFKLVEKFAKIKFKNFLILFLCIPYIEGIENFLHKKDGIIRRAVSISFNSMRCPKMV